MRQYINIDDYKLASPPEVDLCRYCDADQTRSEASIEFEKMIEGLSQDDAMLLDEVDFIIEYSKKFKTCKSCNELENE